MKSQHLFIILIVVVIGGLIFARSQSEGRNVEQSIYDDFAQCIADTGAKFYGAYWCPHCNDQKEAFDNSKNLPYVECSTADGQGQTKVCADAGITGYPTWVFADSSELSGNVPLPDLAEKTGCDLPSQ